MESFDDPNNAFLSLVLNKVEFANLQGSKLGTTIIRLMDLTSNRHVSVWYDLQPKGNKVLLECEFVYSYMKVKLANRN